MKIESPLSANVLAVHQHQGLRNDCAPIATAMAANALAGLGVDGFELAEQLNHVRWRGLWPVIRRIPNWATFPWGVVDALRDLGIRARWRLFKDKAWLLDRLDTDEVLITITGSLRPLWAHMMVLLAYDDQRGYGFANPAFPEALLYWLPAAQFEQRWRAFGRMAIEVIGAQEPVHA